MAQIYEFPKRIPTPDQVPDYSGRLLALNPEKAHKFQCGGFILGPRRMCAVVEPRARMVSLYLAIQDGILLDITDETQDVKTKYSVLTAVKESDTRDKLYIIRRQDVIDLGLECFAYITDEDRQLDDVVCICTSNPEEQRLIDARLEEKKHCLVLPPGMDDPDKYLLKL
jgi:hypothetical protein